MLFKNIILLITLVLVTFQITFADDETIYTDGEVTGDDVYLLEDIDVVETVGEGSDSGVTEISREIIRNIPSGNQGITDMLKIAPGVQFSEDYRGAGSAGEIKPAAISISGGKIYENLFLLDGMSNSSTLDPSSNNPNLANDVAGDPQKFFISQWLVEDLTLLDSDISAAYDGFQGGVVDVKVRQPGKKMSGNFNYRGTNNYLTNFFINDDIRKEFDRSSQSTQLFFEKHFLSAALDIPIKGRGGLLLSYNRNWSKIPLKQFKEWKPQYRTSESYYLKGIYHINSSSYLDTSLSYSPNSGEYFIKNAERSDFTINGGGIFWANNYVNEVNGHKIKAHIDYSYNENSKDSPDIFKSWVASPNKPWGYQTYWTGNNDPLSTEGGFGSIDKYEHAFKTTFDHNIRPLEFFGTHKISYGVVYSYNTGGYRRLNDGIQYKQAIQNPGLICREGDDTCVEADQYLSKRYISRSTKSESDANNNGYITASINNFGAYIEEDYQIERINIRLGFRLQYDDYMENVNFSPRARLSIDLFNNKNTIITGGYGRYYAASMLHYKLREGRKPSYYEVRSTHRNEVQNWGPSISHVQTEYKFSDLKTPYNDEYTASINQKILDSFINLKYLERHGLDGIATSRKVIDPKDGIYKYSFNNNGTSFYRSVQLKWQKNWKNHNIMANITWSQSESSNDSYDDAYDIEQMEDFVMYNGNKIKRSELPNDNFARPIIMNISYVGRFFKHLKFSVTLNYKSPYKSVEQVDDSSDSTEIDKNDKIVQYDNLDTYEDITFGHNATVDIGLYWEQQLYKTHKLTLFTEVYNLFNTKNVIGKTYSGNADKDYELGTQVWFGVNYEF